MFELHRIYDGLGRMGMDRERVVKKQKKSKGTSVAASVPTLNTTMITEKESEEESDKDEGGRSSEESDEYEDAVSVGLAMNSDMDDFNDNDDDDEVVVETYGVQPRNDPLPSPLPERFNFATTLTKDTYFQFFHEWPEDELQFVKWWTGISPPEPITFRRRFSFFMSRSLFGDVILPGKVLEKVLRGTHEEQLCAHYLARFATYIIFLLVPFYLLFLFLLGLVTLGLLWPKWLREFLFFGSIRADSTSKEDLVVVKDTIMDLMGEISELKAMVNESNRMLVEQNIPAWRR